MTETTIDGETFRVEVEGDESRPALVLSHSLGCDLSLWDGQMAAFAERFRVIRYDGRGHGGSAIGSGPYSLARLGRDVLAILDGLGIARAHFCGISMGGAVGQWLMVNAPERVERVVLANTAARLGTPDGWNERIRSVADEGMEPNARSTLERWFDEGFAKDSAAAASVAAVLRKTSAEGYGASCSALRDMDLREALRAVHHPVLVLTGADDSVIPPESTRELLAALSEAKHVELPTRHLSNVEAADAFTAAVVAFLTAKTVAKPGPAARKPTTRKSATRRSAARVVVAARRPVVEASPTVGKGRTAGRRAAEPKAAASSSSGRRTTTMHGAARPPARPPSAPKASRTAGRTADAKPKEGKQIAVRAGEKSRAAATAKPKTTAKTSAGKIVVAKSKAPQSKAATGRTAKASAARTASAKAIMPKRGTAKGIAGKRSLPKLSDLKAAAAKAAVSKVSASKASRAKAVANKTAKAKPPIAKASIAKSRGPQSSNASSAKGRQKHPSAATKATSGKRPVAPPTKAKPAKAAPPAPARRSVPPSKARRTAVRAPAGKRPSAR